MAEPAAQSELIHDGASPEVVAVRELVEERERWPLQRYREQGAIDWLRLANAWTAVALGFVEVVLAFRLGFLLAAANPDNGFVNLIYDVTHPLAVPFTGILPQTKLGSAGVFDPSLLVAMLAYLIGSVLLMSVAWAVTETGEVREAGGRHLHST